jgi:hypothetical protein
MGAGTEAWPWAPSAQRWEMTGAVPITVPDVTGGSTIVVGYWVGTHPLLTVHPGTISPQRRPDS